MKKTNSLVSQETEGALGAQGAIRNRRRGFCESIYRPLAGVSKRWHPWAALLTPLLLRVEAVPCARRRSECPGMEVVPHLKA